MCNGAIGLTFDWGCQDETKINFIFNDHTFKVFEGEIMEAGFKSLSSPIMFEMRKRNDKNSDVDHSHTEQSADSLQRLF